MFSSLFAPYAPPMITDLPGQLTVLPRKNVDLPLPSAATLFAQSRRRKRCDDDRQSDQQIDRLQPEIEIDPNFDHSEQQHDDDLWGGLEDEFTTGLVYDEDDEVLPAPGDFWLERNEEEG